MKIALITDTHFGARSDSQYFLDMMATYMTDVFIPYLIENNIKTVFHLGDLVDRRKYINFNVARYTRKYFIESLLEHGITLHYILGNHDVFYKNTNELNSIEELYGKYKFFIYKDASEIQLNQKLLLLLPWINDDNKERTFDLIQNSNADIVLGHLEIAGFDMHHAGSACETGIDSKIFYNFDLVCSGHFHHKSTNGNINYLGSPYETTWADYQDPKGFHILDIEDNSLTFIQNENTIFEKIIYDDANTTLEKLLDFDFEKYKNKICKVIVVNKNSPYWFDMFVDKLDELANDVDVVEDHLNLGVIDDTEIVSQAEGTLDIIKHRVKSVVDDKKKQKRLEILMTNIYIEASAEDKG